MKRSYLLSLFIFFYFSSGITLAGINELNVIGGSVHLSGKVAEGGCVVFTDSQDMHIDMGQYNTHSFDRIGSLSTQSVPFTITLVDCTPGIRSEVGLSFSGRLEPKEPDLFLVTSSDSVPFGTSGQNGFSGLGLMISDFKGHQIMPDKPVTAFYNFEEGEGDLHFFARYRAASLSVYPSMLSSDIEFNVTYP